MNIEDLPTDDSLRKYVTGTLNNYAEMAALESDQPRTAEELSKWVVETFAKTITLPEVRINFAKEIEPLVQAWLDGRH